MEFPNVDLRSELACYEKLVELFHPEGLFCPHCGEPGKRTVHRRHPASTIADYRCGRCGHVFNAWTGTCFHGTHHRPSELMKFVRAVHEGVPTSEIARELKCRRGPLLALRRRLGPWVANTFGPPPRKGSKRPQSRKDTGRRLAK